jgi:hypothetical protein
MNGNRNPYLPDTLSIKKGTMEAIGYFIIEHRSAIRFVMASYFIVIGTIGFRSLLHGTKEKHKEFTERSRAFKFGIYFRELLFHLSDVILGAIILQEVSWAKIFGIVLLVSSTMYSARGFAWGFAKGKPSGQLFLLSLAGFCIWNGFLIYLMYMIL